MENILEEVKLAINQYVLSVCKLSVSLAKMKTHPSDSAVCFYNNIGLLECHCILKRKLTWWSNGLSGEQWFKWGVMV